MIYNKIPYILLFVKGYFEPYRMTCGPHVVQKNNGLFVSIDSPRNHCYVKMPQKIYILTFCTQEQMALLRRLGYNNGVCHPLPEYVEEFRV